MDILRKSTITPLEGLSRIAQQQPQLSAITFGAILSIVIYLLSKPDPYNLRKVPVVKHPRILDVYRSGSLWRFFLPRILPYVKEGYYKYSKNGKPFKIWSMGFQRWIYVLPAKYLARIKNIGVTELSFQHFVGEVLSPEFSTGHFDNFEIQVASKLVNGNLSEIKPLIQIRTDEYLQQDIGDTHGEWKTFNGRALCLDMMKYVSGRVVFGANLADNKTFTNSMERYTRNVIPSGLLPRFLNLGPLRKYFVYLVHLTQRHRLATATHYVTEEIAERKRLGLLSEDEKPVDCIQWAMDQDIPDDAKTPENIAHRLLHLSVAIIDTPALAMMNQLYDIASYVDCLDELRAEITECLAEAGGGWNERAMSKMRKFDSFMQESFRHNPGLLALTGWRIVTSDTFRFDETFVLPKGKTIVFPSICIAHDPDIHPDPAKFDPLRFYKIKEEDRKASSSSIHKDIRTEWLMFGYGRQACPGRFYSLRLLKTIIGELILRYDIRYAGGDRPRPDSVDLDPIFLADTSIDLEFRSRGRGSG